MVRRNGSYGNSVSVMDICNVRKLKEPSSTITSIRKVHNSLREVQTKAGGGGFLELFTFESVLERVERERERGGERVGERESRV